MGSGRKRKIETRMKGNVNFDKKLTDLYLPRKCDYSDRLITPNGQSFNPTQHLRLERRRHHQPRQVEHPYHLWFCPFSWRKRYCRRRQNTQRKGTPMNDSLTLVYLSFFLKSIHSYCIILSF